MPPAKNTKDEPAKDESRNAAEDEPADTPDVSPGIGGLCAECYPDGWPEGATGLGCQHGTWTRTGSGVV